MTDTVALQRTRADYDANAARYAEFIDDPANRQPLIDAMITAFAQLARGRVLDAGCGPGQWTAFLRDHGLAAEGVDLSPGQIAIARSRRPDIDYTVGSVLELAAADGVFGGVLAHFSLIHTPPSDLPAALAEFARVLLDGGVLLLGGFADVDLPGGWVEYDHKVSPAFRWSPETLVAAVSAAGFVETARLVMQPPPGARSAAVYVLATKTAT